MRQGAVLAAMLAIASAGCAAIDPAPPGAPDPATWELRRNLSRDAILAAEAGDPGRALALLRQLAEADPRSAEALARIGRILMDLGRDTEAADAFSQALKRDPEYVDALIGLGRVELRRGRAALALEHFDAAVEIDPDQPDGNVGRGQSLEALGRFPEAMAAYFLALSGDPDDRDALVRLASIQLDRRQPESALARLDQLVELSPEDPEARLLRGRARLALSLTDDALDDLRFASDHLPGRADAAYHLALAYEQADDLDAARDAADDAARLAPSSPVIQTLADRLRR